MRFEKLLMCFILDKNVSQFIGTPGAFVKQFHYLSYVILDMNGNRMVLLKETSCQNEMHGMLIFKKNLSLAIQQIHPEFIVY